MKSVVVIFLIAISPIGVFAQTNTLDYKVCKGETLYGLSQKFSTTVSHLLDINPTIVNNNLKDGATIKVPMMKVDADYNSVKIGPPQFIAPLTYTIDKGETLYSISKKMNANVESLRMWNELKNDNIKVGQKLIVGYGNTNNERVNDNKMVTALETIKVEPINVTGKEVVKTGKEISLKDNKKSIIAPDTLTAKQDIDPSPSEKNVELIIEEKKPATSITSVVSNPITIKNTGATTSVSDNKLSPVTTNRVSSPGASKQLVYLTEKGVITWTKNNNDDGEYYALHPSAPIGTIITVKNMMNSKTLQVKVIGKLPNTADNQGVLMKISNSTARALNVLDDKFLSTANYMGYKAE